MMGVIVFKDDDKGVLSALSHVSLKVGMFWMCELYRATLQMDIRPNLHLREVAA